MEGGDIKINASDIDFLV